MKHQIEYIEKLSESLKVLNQKELEQVEHIVDSIKESKAGCLHYLGCLLGIDVSDRNKITMDLGMQNANTYGVAQGGALYTLADVAIGYKIISESSNDNKVLTMELKVNYVKQGKGDKLFAKPSILHQGKNTVVAECKITDKEGDLVAVALGTFFIMDTNG